MNIRRLFLISAMLVSMSIAIPAFSQTMPEMVTDRPDQTESTNIVQPGYVQIESGLLLTHAGDNDVTEIPGTLVRIGVQEKLELRAGIDGWINSEAADKTEFGDSGVSAKYYLASENGLIPESAVMVEFGIPTSEGNDNMSYTLRYAGGYTLSDRLSAGCNLAGIWADENLDMSLFYSAVLGYSIDSRTGCFFEFFGESPVDTGGKPANLLDGGFTYLIRGNLQLDLYGGVGMTDAAKDWFLGTGVCYLFGY